MKMKKSLILLAVPALIGCNSLVNEDPSFKPSATSEEVSIDYNEEYKVLFIGNSFTYYNDLDQITSKLAESMGFTKFSADRVACGAYHLSQFADGNDEYGKQVEEKIKNNTYTHIIMQEHSTSPVSNYDSFLSGATALLTKLKTYQTSAKISLYETWGFNNMVGTYGATIPECELALMNAYKNCAKALKLGVHYVGRGFSKVYQEHSSINLYYVEDNKHPSFSGSYLSGLIHLASLTGADVRTATYHGVKDTYNTYGETYVSDEDATILKEVAYNVYNQYGTNY